MTLEKKARSVVINIERSDGQTFNIGTGTDWRMKNDAIADWNTLDYSVNTEENVLDDGSRVVSKRVNEKDRTLSAIYMGDSPSQARTDALAFFNPKMTYKVHLEYHGRRMWCEGEQIGFDCSTHNIYQPPEITWTVLCPNPYMRSESGNNYMFGDATAGIGFPYVSHNPNDLTRNINYPAGHAASIRVFDGKNSVYNRGDVATYYRVEIKANDRLENPTITKDGKFVKVLTTLYNGDVLLIDFESSPPRVTINGENAIQKCSRDSNFTGMKMQTGRNVFTFSIDNMINRSLAEVRVIYNDKFIGI